MNIIEDIRKKQYDLIVTINSVFDEIVNELSDYNYKNEKKNLHEITMPLFNTKVFKGKKVISVIINEESMAVHSWKNAVLLILSEVLKNKQYKEKIKNLRGKIYGRTRKRLAASSKDMVSPLRLDKNLYIESHYDTETLLNLLLQILNEISYDYSNIKIVIKN